MPDCCYLSTDDLSSFRLIKKGSLAVCRIPFLLGGSRSQHPALPCNLPGYFFQFTIKYFTYGVWPEFEFSWGLVE